MFKKTLSLTVIVSFFLTSLGPLPKAHADTVLGLPAPGTMVSLSPAYEPVMIKGLTVHKDNPFLFDFIVDVGQDKMSGEPLKKEGEKLIKYFLASLAIPDKDVWVNLSPYEKNRMIPEALGQTDMGRDLLEQDYILKQITASLIYPEKQLGKNFWNRVYAKAQEMYGTTQVPVNTFNKVWIMADRAEVFEHNQTAFVVDQHLKVMLEEDYLAITHHSQIKSHTIASQIVKQIILPELEKEVNTGKNFANLRQIFNSIILSSWYKRNLKEALLNQIYADKARVKGINLSDPTVKQQIYEQYLKAYKKGVFNYIKEDVNATSGAAMPRKYFSGGIDEAMAATPTETVDPAALNSLSQDREMVDFTMLASTQPKQNQSSDQAMVGELLEYRSILNAFLTWANDEYGPSAYDGKKFVWVPNNAGHFFSRGSSSIQEAIISEYPIEGITRSLANNFIFVEQIPKEVLKGRINAVINKLNADIGSINAADAAMAATTVRAYDNYEQMFAAEQSGVLKYTKFLDITFQENGSVEKARVRVSDIGGVWTDGFKVDELKAVETERVRISSKNFIHAQESDVAMLSDDIIHVVDVWLESSDKKITEAEKDQLRRTLGGFSTNMQRLDQWKFAINTAWYEYKRFKNVEELSQFLGQLPGMGEWLRQKTQVIDALNGENDDSQKRIYSIFATLESLINTWERYGGGFLTVDIIPKKSPLSASNLGVSFVVSGEQIPNDQLFKMLKGEDAAMLTRVNPDEEIPVARGQIVTFKVNSLDSYDINGSSGVVRSGNYFIGQATPGSDVTIDGLRVTVRNNQVYARDISRAAMNYQEKDAAMIGAAIRIDPVESSFTEAELILNQLMFPNAALVSHFDAGYEIKRAHDLLRTVVRGGSAQMLANKYLDQEGEGVDFQNPQVRRDIENLLSALRNKIFSENSYQPSVVFNGDIAALQEASSLLHQGAKINNPKERRLWVDSARAILRTINIPPADSLRELLKSPHLSLTKQWPTINGLLTKSTQYIYEGHKGSDAAMLVKLNPDEEIPVARGQTVTFKVNSLESYDVNGASGVVRSGNYLIGQATPGSDVTIDGLRITVRNNQVYARNISHAAMNYQEKDAAMTGEASSFIEAESILQKTMSPFIPDLYEYSEIDRARSLLNTGVRTTAALRLAHYIGQKGIRFQDFEVRLAIENLLSEIRKEVLPNESNESIAFFNKEVGILREVGSILYHAAKFESPGIRKSMIDSAKKKLETINNQPADLLKEFLRSNDLRLPGDLPAINGLLASTARYIEEGQIRPDAAMTAMDIAEMFLEDIHEGNFRAERYTGLHVYTGTVLIKDVSLRPGDIALDDTSIDQEVKPLGAGDTFKTSAKEAYVFTGSGGRVFVFSGNGNETVLPVADTAMASRMNTPGGIDLNTSNGMQWKVTKDGRGVEMNIDPAMIEKVRREGIDSLSPVILKMTPVISIWSLVGLQAPIK